MIEIIGYLGGKRIDSLTAEQNRMIVDRLGQALSQAVWKEGSESQQSKKQIQEERR